MDNKILPNESYVTEYGAMIRTRCPKDRIEDSMIHQRVLSDNLSAGDVVKVQCFNHSRTTVLYFAEYLVYDRSSEIRRIEVNDRDHRQVEDTRFSIIHITPWQATPAAKIDEPAGKMVFVPPETEVSKAEVKWNPGKKKHQVIVNGEVIGESEDKEEAQKMAEAA